MLIKREQKSSRKALEISGKRSISRRPRLASLVESPVAFNDLRAPHPRRAALVRVTLSSRPSMSLNFRASSTRHTLYDDVNCDVQVHKPSRTVVPKRRVVISSNGPLRKRIFRRDP